MGKYAKYEYKQIKERRWSIHPIWRGIGCFFLGLVPLMSYAGALLAAPALRRGNLIYLPPEVNGYFDLNVIFKYVPTLVGILPRLGRIYYLHLVLMGIFMVIGFGLMTAVYAILYQAVGPKRYGPVDSPPVESGVKKRRRN